MRIGSVQERVTVTAESPASARTLREGGVTGGVPGGVAGGVAGGLAQVPPPLAAPVADTLRAMQPAAAAADLGDLFEYRITEPVTIPKDESALVPILNAEVAVEKISLWTRASGSGRPLRAVWMTNTSSLTLDGGSFSVVEREAFAGEGLMEPFEPGERRLLSYAGDLGVFVSAEAGKPTNRIVRLRARDGVIIQDTEEHTTAVYRVRNEDGAPRMVVVEHPLRSGWHLAGGPEPAGRSPVAYRFRVPVEARREVTLEVPESRTVELRIAVGEIDESRLELWTRSGLAAADVERALKPVLEKRREVAALEQQITRLEAERQAIFEDQQRLRENVKVLGRSARERQLLERYTQQLDQQENRLEAVQRELARATDERDRARSELAQLISEVAFEMTAAKS